MADENESFSTERDTIGEDHIEYRAKKKASERGYLIKFVNGRRTEDRQCIPCGRNIKRKDSNTLGLRRHKSVCEKQDARAENQSELLLIRLQSLIRV